MGVYKSDNNIENFMYILLKNSVNSYKILLGDIWFDKL